MFQKVLGIVLIFVLFIASGCWNRREVETLGFVKMVAVDKAEDPDKVLLTVQIAVASQLGQRSRSRGGGTEQPANWVISSTGSSTFEAVRNFLQRSPRRLNWSHNRIIVFGEDLARDGVKEVLDFFDRDGETRRTAWVAVAKNARGADILKANIPIEVLTSDAIVGLIERTRKGTSTAHHSNLHQFLQALSAPGIDPHASRLELIVEKDIDPRESSLPQSVKSNLHVKMVGTAVFKEDRLVGWLNQESTRGILFVEGEAVSGILMIQCGEDPQQQIGVELLRPTVAISTKVKNGRLVSVIDVDAEGHIGDQECSSRASISSLNKRFATVIKNEVTAAITILQQDFRADMAGIGLNVYRSMPDLWRKIQDRWDEIYPTIPVEVKVKANLRRQGKVTVPVGVR